MFLVKAKRVFISGVTSFFRNGFISLSSILVMSITLFIIGSLIFLGGFLKYSLDQVKQKVDINVYFVTDSVENDILSIKKSLESLPEVDTVSYVSRDQALVNFKDKYKDNDLMLQALDELGNNPLRATLNIKAKEPSQYSGVAEFLKSNSVLSKDDKQIIDSVDYNKNKVVIDKLSKLIQYANTIGLWLAGIFVVISLMITLNTVKLTIFMAKDEISVMRLVGASSRFVRGPFMVGAILCGFISAMFILVLFGVVTYWINHSYADYFAGFNTFRYYLENLWWIFLTITGLGIILGAVASYLAVRKYLRE